MHVIQVIAETLRPVESASVGMAALWIFSAGVSALATPSAQSSPSYQWLFRFLHLLAANLDRAGLFEPHGHPKEERL